MRAIPIAVLGAALLLAACQKEPGVGGKAEIRGKVHAVELDKHAPYLPTGNEFDLPEARVYIVYGDHEVYDDDTRTGPDGMYRFSWLRKGTYTVFAYSFCPTCDTTGYMQAVSEEVEVKDKKDVIDVPTLEVKVSN